VLYRSGGGGGILNGFGWKKTRSEIQSRGERKVGW